jgi:hypothetical protein
MGASEQGTGLAEHAPSITAEVKECHYPFLFPIKFHCLQIN